MKNKQIIMKYIYAFLIMLSLFFISTNKSYAQLHTNLHTDLDTVVKVYLDNYISDGKAGTFKFDIYLSRKSPTWHLWENATFQMIFLNNDSTEIDYSKFDVEIDDSGTEIIQHLNNRPTYSIHAKILIDNDRNGARSRLKIVVVGPDEPIYNRQFEFGEHIRLKLCSVILTSKEKDIIPPPTWVDWKTPIMYYQATAYKYIDAVNTSPEYYVVSNDEDNMEVGWVTSYGGIDRPTPNQIVEFFEVQYIGNLQSVCRWKTLSEFNCAGWVIKRGVVDRLYDSAGYEALPDDIFTEVIGDYRLPEFTKRMTGQLFSYSGVEYDPLIDTSLPYRMVNYVYRLYYEDVTEPGLIKAATRSLLTPNGVITRASASPNPCSGESFIEYVVDDDVYLTCEVFDQNGKSVKKLTDDVNGLLDMKYVPLGKYVAHFLAPELASQGLYEIIFIAYPINDKTVEISRATVKLQLIRGFTNN